MTEEDEHFRALDGIPGRIYVPRSRKSRKHPCVDCYTCQWCADTRCCVCRRDEEDTGCGRTGGQEMNR